MPGSDSRGMVDELSHTVEQTHRLEHGLTIRMRPAYGRESITTIKRGMESGFLDLFEGSKKMGQTDITIHHETQTYPFGDEYPADSALISSIEIDEDHRGQGKGRALLTFAENYARKRGAHRMYVTSVQNDSFWLKMGYSCTGTHRVWVKEM